MRKRNLAVAIVLLLAMGGLARAAEVSEPVILVAKPELRDPLYGSSVLVVTPLGDDQHVGFIVNRPISARLGGDPLYLGGPTGSQLVFAMVQRPDSPGGKSLPVMPGLYVALDAETVDRIIESESDHARLMTGLVTWRPGELSAEIEGGAWYVLEPDPTLVMREPEGLWEELVRRAQRAADTI